MSTNSRVYERCHGEAVTLDTLGRCKPDSPPPGSSGVTYLGFSSTHAALVCDLLREGRTDPDLWTWAEREAVTRLHQYRSPEGVPS